MNQDPNPAADSFSRHNGNGAVGGGMDELFAAPQLKPEDEARLKRQRVLGLLRGRWHWAVLLAILLATAGGFAGYYSQGPEYSSRGLLQFNPVIVGVLPGEQDDPARIEQYFKAWLAAQIEIMFSSQVMNRASNSDTFKEAYGDSVGIGLLIYNTDISVRESGNLVDVEVEWDDPEVAAAAANAIMNAYTEVQKTGENELRRQRLNALEERRLGLNAQRSGLDGRLRALSSDAGPAGILKKYDDALGNVSRYRQLLREVQVELEGTSNETGEEERRARRQGMSIAEIALVDPEMASLLDAKEQVDGRRQQLIDLGYDENHYRMRELRAQVNAANARIDRYAEAFRNGSATGADSKQMAALTQRKQQLGQLLAQSEREMTDLSQTVDKIYEIQGELKVVEAKANQVEAEISQIQNERFITGRVEIMKYAGANNRPSNGRKRVQLAGAGIVGGTLGGFALVMALGLLDRRMRHAGDIDTDLPQTRILGILPTLPKDMTDPDGAERASHSVHHIRTLLEIGSNRHGEGGRVFSVTSPAAGSGKSSLCSALGLSFAASGSRTLLIDADVVGGGLSSRMGARVRRPLSQVIEMEGAAGRGTSRCGGQGVASEPPAAAGCARRTGAAHAGPGRPAAAQAERPERRAARRGQLRIDRRLLRRSGDREPVRAARWRCPAAGRGQPLAPRPSPPDPAGPRAVRHRAGGHRPGARLARSLDGRQRCRRRDHGRQPGRSEERRAAVGGAPGAGGGAPGGRGVQPRAALGCRAEQLRQHGQRGSHGPQGPAPPRTRSRNQPAVRPARVGGGVLRPGAGTPLRRRRLPRRLPRPARAVTTTSRPATAG